MIDSCVDIFIAVFSKLFTRSLGDSYPSLAEYKRQAIRSVFMIPNLVQQLTLLLNISIVIAGIF